MMYQSVFPTISRVREPATNKGFRGKQDPKSLGDQTHLGRVSGLEGTPNEDRGICDNVPVFSERNARRVRIREFLSPQRKKMNDGHVTGQETPYRHGPCRLCRIDISP